MWIKDLMPTTAKYAEARYLNREYAAHLYSAAANGETIEKLNATFATSLPFVFRFQMENPYRIVNSPILGRFNVGNKYATISTQYDYNFTLDDVVEFYGKTFMIKDKQVEYRDVTRGATTLKITPQVKITYINLIEVSPGAVKIK